MAVFGRLRMPSLGGATESLNSDPDLIRPVPGLKLGDSLGSGDDELCHGVGLGDQ